MHLCVTNILKVKSSMKRYVKNFFERSTDILLPQFSLRSNRGLHQEKSKMGKADERGKKKYILLLCVFCHAHAMEKEHEDFRLVQLPLNASNRIAHFLGWETKEAFIKRTCDDIKVQKRILYNNVVSADKTKQAIFCNFKRERDSELNVYHIQDNGNKHIIFNMPFDVGYKFTKLAFNQQGTILLARYLYFPCQKEWFNKSEKVMSHKKL